MTVKTYTRKLADPRWQKKRLKIFERDGWACVECGEDSLELHVHHEAYQGEPWDAPDERLKTLCVNCHEKEHEGALSESDRELIRMLENPACAGDVVIASGDALAASVKEFIVKNKHAHAGALIENYRGTEDGRRLARIILRA